MAKNQTIEDQVKKIQAQIQLLQAQNDLLTKQNLALTSQVTNLASQKTAQASIDKAVAEKTKELLDAELNLEKARAKAPFAKLLGVKEALSGLTIQGKEGTITVNKGTDGALLLRAKKEMLEALDDIAQEIVKLLPANQTQFVIASKEDLESAYKSELLLKRIDTQKKSLEQAQEEFQPQKAEVVRSAMEGLPVVMAGVEAAGLALGALSDLGKFFRVDRSISIFEGSEEAQQILETLLEAHVAKSNPQKELTTRLNEPNEDVLSEATGLLEKLNQLKKTYKHASDLAATIQKQADEAAKQFVGSSKTNALVDPQAVADLKGKIDNAKALLDAINPDKNADAFWAQVAGQVKRKRTNGKARIILIAKAQTAVTIEKRSWRSDRLVGSGEIQVLFRVTDASGNYLTSGVLLRTTPTCNACVDSAGDRMSLPAMAKPTVSELQS